MTHHLDRLVFIVELARALFHVQEQVVPDLTKTNYVRILQ